MDQNSADGLGPLNGSLVRGIPDRYRNERSMAVDVNETEYDMYGDEATSHVQGERALLQRSDGPQRHWLCAWRSN